MADNLVDRKQEGLFRQEVLEGRRRRIDGEVLLARPMRAHVPIALLAVSVTGLGLWLSFGHYMRTESVKGILTADNGTAKIIAIRPGVVVQMPVSEGQSVRKGQALATIQVDQQYAMGGRATQEGLAALHAQQVLSIRQTAILGERAESERSALTATIVGDRQQAAAVRSQIDIQQQVVATLEEALARIAPVAERGFVSRIDMDRRRQELLVGRQEIARLQQQLIALLADAARLNGQLKQSAAEQRAQAASAQSSSEALEAQASQLRGAQAYVLTAPNDGVVTALQAAVGRTVDGSLPLMAIVPLNAPVHAELYAPSRAIGFVKPGQEVRLLYDTFPYERFGSFRGSVQTISHVALDPREIAGPLRAEEPVYRISVLPEKQMVPAYNEHFRLQPGMTLTANIVLERRSFLDWLFQPLHAVMARYH